MSVDPWLVLAAAALEAAVGYPARLHRYIPHPVVWVGRLIGVLDRTWNQESLGQKTRRLLGVLTVLLVIVLSGLTGWAAQSFTSPFEAVFVIAIGWIGLAQRSLFDHVDPVKRALQAGDLITARHTLGAIVGRDVDGMQEADVAAAALESLAESFNDGVVAPMFWFVLAGLPGLLVYKAVNTADSMIGHMEPRWRSFGWAAARTDDLMNLIPARLAGLLICLVGFRGWNVMMRDAGKHASPNSGWPEAAMAGALNVKLGGPVTYDGIRAERASLGSGRSPASADLDRGLKLYVAACGVLWLLLAVGGLAWPR